MIIEIESFAIRWNPKTKLGSARIKLKNGKDYSVPVGSAEELAALGLVLNEAPVVVDTNTGDIFTKSWEPVGHP